MKSTVIFQAKLSRIIYMSKLKEISLLALTGAITGFVNGFFGGGGGMIVVPMLIFLLKMKTKTAHATALAVILPVTVISAALYLSFGSFAWKPGIPVTVGVTAGGVAGAFLLRKLSNKWITRIFALIMLVAGFKLLFF